MKSKNLLLFILILLHAGVNQAQVSLDDCWGYVNTLRDEWLRKICTVGLDTVYIVGENGLIARSTDRGETWDKQYVGTAHLNDIKFVDTYVGFAVGESGTILKTTDAGETWTQQTSGTTENINAFAFTGLNNLWAVGEKSLVLHSTDGGTTWKKENIVDVECTLNDIAFRGSLGYFVGTRDQAYKTTDEGKNWKYEKISSFPPSEYREFQKIAITQNVVYILSDGWAYSIKEQTAWTEFEIKGGAENFCFFNDSTGYSVGYNATTGSEAGFIDIRKTDNYGQNWEAGFCFDNTKMYLENENINFGDMRYPDMKVVNDTLGYAIFGKYFYRMPGQEYILTKIQCYDEPDILTYQSGNMLHIESRQKPIVSVSFFDVLGRSVLHFPVYNKCEVGLNDLNLSSGLIVIKCTFSDNSSTVAKWIKY